MLKAAGQAAGRPPCQQRRTPDDRPEIHKGLAGVVVDTTTISSVNPQTNSLPYRGYPVQELAAHCSFEEVAYLLWHGELPNADQLVAFESLERTSSRLDDRTRRALEDASRRPRTPWTRCARP
ncbi:citrate/2-methylcitrate synthase [Leifsonia sp. L25]|uniref:citrate/2-methylcitrate synthase n=1 Tax=Leifsonia sp. L25 TaxID=3423957 RepID=UPI003D694CF7